jgi:hypothetical protein
MFAFFFFLLRISDKMLRKVGIAQKKRAFDFDFWIIGGIFMKKFVAGVVALMIAFGGMALPAESGFSAVSANAEEVGEDYAANEEISLDDGEAYIAEQSGEDVQVAGAALTYGDYNYTVLDDGTVEITKYAGSDKEVVIPSTINGKKVTSIGEKAFYFCESLTKVTIPNSVTSIGEDAFFYCRSLASVTIPNSVISIGDSAFYGCASITSITIPNSVASMDECAFYGCTGLKSITIPNSVTSIASTAFMDCSSLANITVGSKNKNYSSEDGVLFNKDKTELCIYPAGNSKKEYKIPSSVTSIGNDSFSDCKNLKNITISNSVAIIGAYAFSDCSSLTKVTIPDSTVRIGANAFIGCTSLTNITVDSKNKDYLSENGVLFNKEKTKLVAYPIANSRKEYIIPSSVIGIFDFSFKRCENLEKVTLYSNVTAIGFSAFSECPKIKDVYYTGSMEDWNKISFGNCNDSLINATIHYNYTPDELTVDKVKTTKFTCTDKAVKINWEKVNGAAGYRVYAYNAKTKKWSKAATVSASTLSFKQTGLKSGTTYKYKVKAYAKQSGKTYWGEASDTMTTTTKPAQPAIKSTSASTSAVRLNWNAVSGANGYRVVRYDANAKKWVSVGTIKTTSFKETKLKGKTSYKYKVKAYRKVGGATYWSEYSAVKSVKTK